MAMTKRKGREAGKVAVIRERKRGGEGGCKKGKGMEGRKVFVVREREERQGRWL